MLFENEPEHRLFFLIGGIWMKMERWTEKQLRALNMTFPQFATLAVLLRGDGITQRELADKTDTDATTITVVCDSLEKKNWIKRVSDPKDRRVNRLVLTENGRDICAKAYPHVQLGYEYVLKNTPAKEIQTIILALERLYQTANDLFKMEI